MFYIRIPANDTSSQKATALLAVAGGATLTTYSAIATLIATMQAASCVAFEDAIALLRVAVDPVVPATGPYATAQDCARLRYRSSQGNTVVLALAGPVAAIFKSDGYTVDGANALVQAITAAAIAVVTDEAGNPVTEFIDGVRVKIQ